MTIVGVLPKQYYIILHFVHIAHTARNSLFDDAFQDQTIKFDYTYVNLYSSPRIKL